MPFESSRTIFHYLFGDINEDLFQGFCEQFQESAFNKEVDHNNKGNKSSISLFKFCQLPKADLKLEILIIINIKSVSKICHFFISITISKFQNNTLTALMALSALELKPRNGGDGESEVKVLTSLIALLLKPTRGKRVPSMS